MATQRPILTDTITRIYKNGLGVVIAVQKVTISESRVGIARTATLSDSITKINEGSGQSRLIVTIQQIGNYQSFTEVAGNYTQVTYIDPDAVLNNLVVSLASLPVLGGTI